MSLCLTLFMDAARLLYWPDMVGSLGGGPQPPLPGSMSSGHMLPWGVAQTLTTFLS